MIIPSIIARLMLATCVISNITGTRLLNKLICKIIKRIQKDFHFRCEIECCEEEHIFTGCEEIKK